MISEPTHKCLMSGCETRVPASSETGFCPTHEESTRNLATQFGEAARHSDYRVGDVITYRVGLQAFTAEIIWITDMPGELAPGELEGRMRYIILQDQWPLVLTGADIVTQS